MYITGDVSSFNSRLHQLATGWADLILFANEGNAYVPANPYSLKVRWNKEFNRRTYPLLQAESLTVSEISGIISGISGTSGTSEITSGITSGILVGFYQPLSETPSSTDPSTTVIIAPGGRDHSDP